MFSKMVPVLVIAAVLASANAIDVYTPTNMTGIGTDCATQICSSCGEGEEQLFEPGKCCPDCVPAGCFETECRLPKCLEGQILTRRKGECCRTCTFDCSAVTCLRPTCEEGEELVVPEGECCPRCQRRCTIKGQFFSFCASRCPRTCNPPPDLFCPTVCVEGCKCPTGQVVDTTKNVCVPEDECPPNDPCDACPEGTICERRVNPCQIPPCPVSITCRNPDPCSATGFVCERGSSCRVDNQTGKAFCEPSCDLDNGGCRKDQTCELQIVQCLNPPCPLKVLVRCIDPVPLDPCANMRCANGYQCEVFKPMLTGEAYCQPNCSLNNGGCSADQECRLQPVICVRAPCPPLIECVERTTECPPTCSKEFCTRKGNRRAMCSNPDPQELPGCTGSCQLTYCHACYYDEESRSLPEYCPECENLQNYLKDSRCFRRWANCIRRDQWLFGHRAERIEENFRCHNPSCSLREVMNSKSLPWIFK